MESGTFRIRGGLWGVWLAESDAILLLGSQIIEGQISVEFLRELEVIR